MTATKKLSMTGAFALFAGITLMTLLHQFASRWIGAHSADVTHGMGMPHEMPWFMPLGPLAMVLTFVGAVTLIVSLVRLASRNG